MSFFCLNFRAHHYLITPWLLTHLCPLFPKDTPAPVRKDPFVCLFVFIVVSVCLSDCFSPAYEHSGLCPVFVDFMAVQNEVYLKDRFRSCFLLGISLMALIPNCVSLTPNIVSLTHSSSLLLVN